MFCDLLKCTSFAQICEFLVTLSFFTYSMFHGKALRESSYV
jgi:hypothetical protein